MAEKIGFISLGCAKNLVDSEAMLARLDEAGYEVTGGIEDTAAVVINTCGFLQSAKEEAAENIREVAALKAEGKVGKIVVAGCLAERYKTQLLEEFPDIDALVGCGSFSEIAQVVTDTLQGAAPARFGPLDQEINGESRVLTTPEYTAYLKIAEGCDNHCAYCVIPSLRGSFRSRALEDVLDEAEGLAESGVKELIVVAQDTSRYGLDRYGKRMLPELLQGLCAIDGIQWIRLHYLYPDEIDDALIDEVRRQDKIVKYLDIPIQHASDRILKAMNRRGDKAYLDGLFRRIREKIPGVVLRTSLIAGLPGETEEEFSELCDFLREHRIERAGVFPYSPEEGSAAAQMPDQVPDEVKLRRCEVIEDLQAGIMEAYNASLIGTDLDVLCEGYDRNIGHFFGRSFADSPDIDGKVFFTATGKTRPKTGEIVPVHITEDFEGNLLGEYQG